MHIYIYTYTLKVNKLYIFFLACTYSLLMQKKNKANKIPHSAKSYLNSNSKGQRESTGTLPSNLRISLKD